MAPMIAKRDAEPEGEEGPERRTRVDDTDPYVIFTPGSSPYLNPQQNASWTVVKDSVAFNGSAVMTNRTDARLSFNFTGDSLTLGLLYKKEGTKLKVTLENGTSFPFEVTAAEAGASARNGDKEALQKKNFRLTGLSCANHTVSLAALPASDGQGGNATQPPLYFDWFSFPSADSSTACTSGTVSAAAHAPLHDDHTMEYIGISLGATLFGFIVALLVTRYLRRREQRKPSSAADPIDRTFRPGHKQPSDESLSMPLNMPHSQPPSVKPSLEHTVFRPRGIHALTHDDSFSSTHTGARASMVDSPNAAAFPLQPVSQEEHMEMVEDAGHSIGSMLLCLEHDPLNRPREARRSGAHVPYEKARLSSSHLPASPTLVGGYELQRMPKPSAGSTRTSKAKSKSRPPRRPKTTSAVDRLRTEAQQLDIQRPLSPFDRTRPTTASGTMSAKPSDASLAAQTRFRRSSAGSGDTRWSRVSAEASSGEGVEAKVAKTDSEDAMWVKREGMRRNSVGAPKRPPRSAKRPSTSQGPAAVPAFGGQAVERG
ncbi:conserved hypothetical protein [Sporisorium reilianum SRZ2]|uniref:Uncharacterized protein n=1 Tax=Sporisorium reilianum (strain SRZ2) TaxID=999809 RepID=E6ZMI3_SPORE|nr:conserved hypothetical protein [Sporisorium reilianum SRZ2]